MITQLFEILFGTERRRRIQREKQEDEEKRQQARRDREAMAGMLQFPEMQISKDDFMKIPHRKDINLKTCPFSTRFICTPHINDR